VITDLVGIDGDLRFAPYFLFPSIAHAVSIKKRGEKLFHVTVGANPWKRHISKIHLGNIVKKYGGGGHQYVGGCEATNYKDAKKIVDDIIKKIS
jgi:nanoRNase/pAp phosphatase (c-di-AMP/oligoRNAs hydrolase)